MRRRRLDALDARERWITGATGLAARAINSQAGMAAITPRADRVASLLELGPGRRYLDIGCGTASYAHLLAARAGLSEPPVCLDLAHGPGPVDAIAWPEQLPLRDESFDAITSLYFVRRFDDEVVHAYARELRRVLAPGGNALVLDIAPVRAEWLNRVHERVVSPGCARVDLRGWARLAALFTEIGFDGLGLVNVGPFFFPPVPRVGILCRRAP